MDTKKYVTEATHVYLTPGGAPALRVTRLKNSSGQKSFFQENFDDGYWKKGGSANEIAPLYFADWGETEQLVFIVEGEKKADKLKSLGVAVTTSPGGAKSWKHEYAKFFAGKDICILPDNDEPGQYFADSIASSIEGVCRSFVVVNLPNLENSEDVEDWINGGGTVDQLQELYNREKQLRVSIESKTVQQSDSPYPLLLLPKPILSFINVLDGVTDAPKPLLAQVGLAMLSSLAGKFVSIRGVTRLNDYFLGVGKTGVRKTTGQKYGRYLLKDVLKIRPDLEMEHASNNGQGEQETKHFKQIENVTNFSVEGLEQMFVGQGNSILLTPGEYKQVFDISRRQAQSNTISPLVSMYDGEPITTTLRSGKIVIPDHYLTMLAVSTATWLKEALSHDSIASGFLNRHLVVMAEMPPVPLVIESSPESNKWNALVREFAAIPKQRNCKVADGKPEWSAVQVNYPFIDPIAQELWKEYFNDLHQLKLKANDHDADLIAREDTHALKLAGLKAFGEGLPDLNADCVLFGIEMARASTKGLKYLAASSNATDEDKMTAKLFVFIKSRCERSQAGTRRSDISKHFGGKQKELHQALNTLVAQGKIIESRGIFYPEQSVRPH